MSAINLTFYDDAPVGLRQKYAVIIAKHNGKLLWCRHQDRQTWEIPGGHIESGETAVQAAARELQEETGAITFTLKPVCWYSACRVGHTPHSSGLLCIADVYNMGKLHSEIAEVRLFDALPDMLTYPEIQPGLMEEAVRRRYI